MIRIQPPPAAAAVLLTVALLGASPVLAAAARLASGSEGGASAPGPDPRKETIDAIRSLGTVLLAQWLERHPPKPGDAAGAEPEPTEADLAKIPRLSSDEIRSRLAASGHPTLVIEDGWGRALEVRLFDGDRSRDVLSIRSCGSDGRCDGDRYAIGAFDSADSAADIVWADGYFVRWPQKK